MVTDREISVSASNTGQGTTDSYQAFPMSYNAKRFFIPSYNHADVGHSQYAIAGLYNDTCVEIWRKVTIRRPYIYFFLLDQYIFS